MNVKVLYTLSTLSCDPGDQFVMSTIDTDCVKNQALRHVIVNRRPRSDVKAQLIAGGVAYRAFLGRSGRSAFKREGDGATPVARMRLRCGYYRSDRVRLPQSRLPMRAIRPDMGWCDAPGHGAYNGEVQLPFAASHERLWREDGLYDICLVLDWNIRERRRFRGSAIFLHLSKGRPTEGCIAVSRRTMLRLLPMLGPRTVVKVV